MKKIKTISHAIGQTIYDLFHPSIESIIDQFGIVENLSITQEEYEELMRILDKWEV